MAKDWTEGQWAAYRAETERRAGISRREAEEERAQHEAHQRTIAKAAADARKALRR